MHINKEAINKLLLHFLKTIYQYERKEIAEFSLGFPEVYILQYLKQYRSKNIGEISSELQVEHFAASRLITRLEKKGYVVKSQDDTDRRVSSVRITPAGLRIVKALEEKHSRTILNNLENNPDLDMGLFIEAAKNIHRILDINIEEE
ncbi:MAG: winged helix DNA-binding protein [Spirochaetales bacterium]|nr:winged helix DNA-binding protein [Spirochaetales bacterium]